MTTKIRLSALCFILLASPLYAAEWNMFHGPDGSNMSPDTGLLTSWGEGGPTLLWTISGIGEGASGFASLTIQNGRLFTTGNRAGRAIVYCFDLDGNKLWEYDNGPGWTGGDPGTRSTPAVCGDFVYDLSPLGELVCLNVATGQRVWGRNILTDFGGENIGWGLSGSLRIDGDKLLCAPGGRLASLIALDKRTGNVIWTTPSLGERAGYGTPTIFEHGGKRIISVTYAKGLFGVNAETGELLFRFRHEHQFDVNATGPIYHDGHLFISNDWRNAGGPDGMGGGIKLRLTMTDGNASLEEVWRSPYVESSQDNAILLDGVLYVVNHVRRGGAFIAADWKTGEILYEGSRVGRGAPLTWAEGLLYVLGTRGEMLLIRPNPERFDVISRFYLPEHGDGPFLAHPVITGQRLYIRHGSFLYCYDLAR